MNIRPRLFPVSRLLLGAFVLSAAALYTYKVQAASPQPPIPRGVAMKSWQENGRDGRYLLQVIKGNAPKTGKPVIGIVTTDTDCDADADGLSHCHNTIKLANGSEITVIDSHNMHINRCLGAGDRLSLTGIDKTWVMGTLPAK
ncbi:MAG: hypothetical protein IH605_00195 [Burkholderiales bacterium]|nr:hypothetical protein [Burkholderiales bacterium]